MASRESTPYNQNELRWQTNEITVLVIISCNNQHATVQASLESLASQSFDNWYAVVVGDGTLGQACIVEADKSIRALNMNTSKITTAWKPSSVTDDPRRVGLGVAKGLAGIKGDSSGYYLCFLDADDKIRPQYLSAAAGVFASVPDVDLIYADQMVHDKEDFLWDVPIVSLESVVAAGSPLPVMTLISLSHFERIGGFPDYMVVGDSNHAFWMASLELGAKMLKAPLIGSDYYIKPDSALHRSDLALSLLKAAHPGLYNNDQLASALNTIHCHLDDLLLSKLRQLVHENPAECNAVLWMWLQSLRRDGKGAHITYKAQLLSCLANFDPVVNSFVLPSIFALTDRLELHKDYCSAGSGGKEIFAIILNDHRDLLSRSRVKSSLGAYIAEVRSVSRTVSKPLVVLLVTRANSPDAEALASFARSMPSVIALELGLDLLVFQSVEGYVADVVRAKGGIDFIYIDAGGRESAIVNHIYKALADPADVKGVFIRYDKLAMDRVGPLPASEFVTRAFTDKHMTFIHAATGDRFTHDHLLTQYLSNVQPTDLIMRSGLLRAPRLPEVRRQTNKTIPSIVHFVFALSSVEEERLFTMQHYLAVKAAYDVLSPEVIYIHHVFEPSGVWWRRARGMVTSHRVEDFTTIFGNPVKHFAHKADIIRLEALLKHGGIYLDLDVWVVRDFTWLLQGPHTFVMGQEGQNGHVGLCNAVIIAHKDSLFLRTWYERYKKFSDKSWNYFSVMLPNELAAQHPSLVHVLPHSAFFWPNWDDNGLSRLYLQHQCEWLKTSFAVHLWSSKAKAHLDELTATSLSSYDTCMFQLARRIFYRERDTTSSSACFPYSHRLEMSDIVTCTVVDSDYALETVRRTWLAVSSSMGMNSVLYTTNYNIFKKHSAALLRAEVPFYYLPAMTGAHRTSDEWKSLGMLHHMCSEYGKIKRGLKWFVKVDANAWLRPDALKRSLSMLDPLQPYYLGALGVYHGPDVAPYTRVTYARGSTYALSAALLEALLPDKLLRCNPSLIQEDVALAICIREQVGIAPYSIPVSYDQLARLKADDRSTVISYYPMSSVDMSDATRLLYSNSMPMLGSFVLPHEMDTLARPQSHLADPKDPKRDGDLATRGGLLSLWQENCFASGSHCGWKGISRTECLQIGCCYKDDFPDYPCMKPGGDYDSETRLREAKDGYLRQAADESFDRDYLVHRVCVAYGKPAVTVVARRSGAGSLIGLATQCLEAVLSATCHSASASCVQLRYDETEESGLTCTPYYLHIDYTCISHHQTVAGCTDTSSFATSISSFLGINSGPLVSQQSRIDLRSSNFDWLLASKVGANATLRCLKYNRFLGETELYLCQPAGRSSHIHRMQPMRSMDQLTKEGMHLYTCISVQAYIYTTYFLCIFLNLYLIYFIFLHLCMYYTSGDRPASEGWLHIQSG